MYFLTTAGRHRGERRAAVAPCATLIDKSFRLVGARAAMKTLELAVRIPREGGKPLRSDSGGPGMPTVTEVVVHGERTNRSGYEYQFTPKHHGGPGSGPDAAQWVTSLNLDEEFAIFDTADEHELSDRDGNLYGVEPDGPDSLRYIGVWNEQVAEFPVAREGEAWHGYPVYPLVDEGPENRRGQKGRPEGVVFTKLVRAGLISPSQRKRIMKGDHA